MQDDPLLDLIYGAAIEPGLWLPLLERIADRMGASSGWLSELDLRDGSGSGVVSRIDPAMQAFYFDHMADQDPLSNVPDPAAFLRDWKATVVTDDAIIPKDRLRRTPFYNEFLTRIDVDSVMMIRLAGFQHSMITLNINRPGRHGGFGDAEHRVARAFHPHLTRAALLGRRLAETRLHPGGERADPKGIAFVLDSDGRIGWMTGAAQDCLDRKRCFTASNDRLALLDGSAAERLARIIGHTLARTGTQPPGGSILVDTDGGRARLRITVAPLRERVPAPFFGDGAAIVTAHPVAEPDTDRSFGLTPAETRLAHKLVSGQSLRSAAGELGVSLNTVRSHLQRLFDKTGTHRQLDMVRTLERLPRAW